MRISGNANDWQTRIRLFAAIIMAIFAVAYFIYYISGLVSVEAMETYQDFLAALTPVFFFLPVAILTHVSLELWKLYKRTTLKMPLWEISQIFLGLCIPVFFVPYLVRSYGLAIFFGAPQTYIDQLRYTYPLFAWQFVAFTLAVWLHAQFGAHVVLRLRPWYPKLRWAIIIVFSLIPVFALAGYFKGESELAGDLQNKEWLADEKPVLHPATAA